MAGFHETLFAASLLGSDPVLSSIGSLSADGLADDDRRDQRVGVSDDVAAAKTAATVLGRRESRPLPSARAMMERDLDCRLSGSEPTAAAAVSMFDCPSLSANVASVVQTHYVSL